MKTILATTTLYNNDEELRFLLACQTVQAATAAGYPIIIVDGSPDPMVAASFRQLGAIVFPEMTEGMGNSRRSQESWDSYPQFQIESEQTANAAYAKATGREGYDPMFGPVAFNAGFLAKYIFWNPTVFEGVEDTYIQHYLPLLTSSEQVASVEVDFIYPPKQRVAEETVDNDEIRRKRMWQLETLKRAYTVFGSRPDPQLGRFA